MLSAIRNYMEGLRRSWSSGFADPLFRLQLLVTVAGFLAFLHWGIGIISGFEQRPGHILSDPVLQVLPPTDFSLPIFALIHSAIVVSAFRLLNQPVRLLLGLQVCLLILLVRTVCLYFVALEPPPGMVLLEDPFLTWVFGSEQQVAVKDLFFSGHVATMCALVYISDGYWRQYLKVATVAVAVLIAWQHVHYSIDIAAAPFFALGCAGMLDRWHRHSEYGLLRRACQLDAGTSR